MPRGARGGGLDGILVVAKSAGPTSHDIVALVRRLAATKRVGHGGTLDPFASGVLPLFLGGATRVVEYHLGDSKTYRATVCFGASSTTDDLEGELTPTDGPGPSREAVESAMAGLVGVIVQRPPAYSAIKIGGRRAYAMARAGEAVVIPEREVTIHALDLVTWDDADPARRGADAVQLGAVGPGRVALAGAPRHVDADGADPEVVVDREQRLRVRVPAERVVVDAEHESRRRGGRRREDSRRERRRKDEALHARTVRPFRKADHLPPVMRT